MNASLISPEKSASPYGIYHGGAADCGEEDHPGLGTGGGAGIINSSLDLQVDDTRAPEYFLVTVKYGLFYQAEGWRHDSYQLKLLADRNGDLRYELVKGNGQNLVSQDAKAKARVFIRSSSGFRLHFFCMATGPAADRAAALFSQSHASLCLRTA